MSDFAFAGKSGKQWSLITAKRPPRRKDHQGMPGFALRAGAPAILHVDDDVVSARSSPPAATVNAIPLSGTPPRRGSPTAKDFRDLGNGTILMVASALNELKTLGTHLAQAKEIGGGRHRKRRRLPRQHSHDLHEKCYVHLRNAQLVSRRHARLLEIKSEVDSELRDGLAELRPEGGRGFWRYCGHAWRHLTATSSADDPKVLHRRKPEAQTGDHARGLMRLSPQNEAAHDRERGEHCRGHHGTKTSPERSKKADFHLPKTKWDAEWP